MIPESPANSLRSLLRNTALHSALLADGARIPAVHLWRARCVALVEQLRQTMHDAGYLETEIEEVSLAQCTLLDNVTLASLPAEQRGDWMRESLQIRFHDTQDGAQVVCERIDALMLGEPLTPQSAPLYQAMLELGFKGDRAEKDSYRQRVMAALGKMQRRQDPEPVRTLIETATVAAKQNSSRRRWSTLGAILALAGAIALWLASETYLNRAVSHLPVAPSESPSGISQGRS
jgi:type VI secretion system protein ImpK